MSSAFGILGLTEDASYEETKNAYRRLIKCWHPDRFPKGDPLKGHAERRMREINIAFETLKLHFGKPLPTREPQPKATQPKRAPGRKRAITRCYAVMRRKRRTPRSVKAYRHTIQGSRLMCSWCNAQRVSLKSWWNGMRQAMY